MYLLTYQAGLRGGRYAFVTGPEGLVAFDDLIRTPEQCSEVELFERRGNDWIRIRPEATNAE